LSVSELPIVHPRSLAAGSPAEQNGDAASIRGEQDASRLLGRRRDEPVADIDLFFADLIASYVVENPRFLERGWLTDRVSATLSEPDCRFVLLTAEPGGGKTALAASLASAHPGWLRYFVRRDQRTPLGDPAAVSFLLRIGFQLAARDPALFSDERIKVSVAQSFREASGDVTGASVERLLASPFHQTIIEIRQQVERGRGDVVGLEVGEWVADPQLLPAADLQFLALIDPAKALGEQDPDRQLVVVVDGVDELRYRDGGPTLLDWAAESPELPPNLRLLLTSRPDDELLARFRGAQEPWLRELVLDADEPDVKRDLDRYARSLAGEPAVAAVVGDAQESFVERAVAKASGNIGYLDAVGRAVDRAIEQDEPELLERALDFEKLPETLEGLYAFFLRQIKDRVRRRDPSGSAAWRTLYRPIIAVLSVAMEPLEPAEIAALGAIEAGSDELIEALTDLRQFLEWQTDRIRFYHATVAQFLTADSTRGDPKSRDLAIDAASAHLGIVMGVRAGARTWDAVDWTAADDYMLRHVAAHLFALRDVDKARTWLYELISPPLMRAKFARFGSHESFALDVNQAARLARMRGDVAEETRCAVVYANLSSITAEVPKEALAVLARIGLAARALAFASLIEEEREQIEVYDAIGRALIEHGDCETAGNTFERVRRAAERVRYPSIRANGLLAAADGLARLGRHHEACAVADMALAAIDEIYDVDEQTEPRARLAAVAARTAQAERALEIATSLYRNERVRDDAFDAVAAAFREEGDLEHALVAAALIAEESRREAALTVVQEDAAAAGRLLEDVAAAAAEPLQRAEALAGAAWLFGRAGAREEAQRTAEGALDLAGTLSETPERSAAEGQAAVALALSGAHEAAAEAARTIVHWRARTLAVGTVAVLAAEAGHVDSALDAVSAIEANDSAYDEIMAALLSALVDAGKWPVKTRRRGADPRAAVLEELERRMSAGSGAGVGLHAPAQARSVDAVLDAADGFGAIGARPEAVLALAERLAAAGDLGDAAELAEQAVDLADGEPHGVRLQHLVRAANVLAATGAWERAIEVAELADSPHDVNQLLSAYANTLAREGRWDDVLAVVRRFGPDDYDRGSLIAALAPEFAEASRWQDALAIAEDIEGARDRDSARRVRAQSLSGIALALAACGDDRAALEILELVLSAPPAEALVYVPDALAEIALALTDIGRAKDAAALGERTLELAERRWHDFIWRRHIASLGRVFAAAGETERALSVVDMLDDVSDVVEALTEAARGLTRKNEAERALTLAEHAYEVAAEEGEEFHVGLAEREIACALAALGNAEEALDLVRELDNPYRQAEALEAVTEFVLSAGDATGLRHAVDAIGDEFQRDWTLRKVAIALARGDYRDEALEAAERLSGGDRIMVVSAVARSLARAGQVDEARPLVERTHADARRQLSRDRLFGPRETELGELTRALVDVGKHADAVALADELLALDGDNESTRAAVAPLFSYAGDHERAADVVALIPPAHVVRDDALREIAPGLVRDGHLARLLQLLEGGAALPRTVAEIVPALVAVNELEACREVWHACLDQARTGDAGEVYGAFSAGAPFIAALDGGRTLVAACEAALAVDAWWRR
jgi:hypothetical protein